MQQMRLMLIKLISDGWIMKKDPMNAPNLLVSWEAWRALNYGVEAKHLTFGKRRRTRPHIIHNMITGLQGQAMMMTKAKFKSKLEANSRKSLTVLHDSKLHIYLLTY